MTRVPCCGAALVALLSSAALPAYAEGPTPFTRLTNPEPQNWLLPHRTYDGWRYAQLEQITPANVANLKLAFAFPLGDTPGTAMQSQPMVDDGFLYVTNAMSVAMKFDVRSGTRVVPLWSYDPGMQAASGLRNRGVALIDDKAVINTPDARAMALNRDSGQVLWEKKVGVQYEGFSSQPLVVKDKVIVGNSKGDSAGRGWIAALSVANGNEVWRFNVVPGPGEPGHETWPQNTDAWKIGGGAVWQPGTYDVATNLLYYGTGNAVPAHDPEYRPGDNLYTASVVVLNADTGKMSWYFQYTPGESFEMDEATPHLLIDTTIGGQARKVFAHHSKNGHFYVLDRTNGAFILAQKNSPAVNWTAGIDPKTGKPVEYVPGQALQAYGGVAPRRGTFVKPACRSYPGWSGEAYMPTLNRVYANVNDSCFDRQPAPPAAGYVFGMGGTQATNRPTPNPGLAALEATRVGPRVTATDVATGTIVAYAQDEYALLATGLMATKSGLIFAGRGDGTLAAYDATSMKTLWSINTGTPLASAPITYAVGNKQYIAVTGGGAGSGPLAEVRNAAMLWVFTL